MHFFVLALHYTLMDNYLGIAHCYKLLGEDRYARYFAELMLTIDADNEEARNLAAIEG